MSFLEIKNLNISYLTRKEKIVASKDVEFSLERGEILGIVGESGSGKSTIANAIINLIDPPGEITDGSIKIDNEEICNNEEIIQKARGKKIGFVFQDPQTSLNPLFKIKDQLIETIQTHLKLNYDQALQRSIQLLNEVGIEDAEKRIEDYPHQFSGGMRQRVVIALAISCEPDLIIADRPDPIGPGKNLFKIKFYKDIKNALSNSGIAVFQNGVPFFQKKELKDTMKHLKSTFNYSGVYLTVVPTYIGGYMALTWSSNAIDMSKKVNLDKHSKVINKLNTQYYTKEIHYTSFILPKWIKEI